MLTTQCLFLLGLAAFPLTEALLSLPIDWDDFSNNFGTDIAPLLSLFGENPTKQFLSESTSFWDSVLFGIAPLGIITTVVSVIRIYGNASWKSFIGRSQEPHGLAEAELCSSTSDDVCELWSNGGICRVFGRPKMLAFIFTQLGDKDTERFYPSKYREGPPDCGIKTPREQLDNIVRGDESQDESWEEIASTTSGRGTDDQLFAPYPNLSLTIGIRHRIPIWVAVVLGMSLRLLFFGLTIYFTYFVPAFYDQEQGQKPEHWGFGLTVGGTIALNLGMTLCARLIDNKSSERHFKSKHRRSQVYWLQPGGQRVGDQLFNAFAYCDSGKDEQVKYTTSWPVASDEAASSWQYYTAVVVSMLGWVVQFVGLRFLPGSVSLALFVFTVIMSLIRAGLRSSRLPATANLLQDFGRDVLEDHELDWQALELVHSADGHHEDQGHDYCRPWDLVEERDSSSLVNDSPYCMGEWDTVWKWMRDKELGPTAKSPLNEAAQAFRLRSRLAYLTSEQTQLTDQAWSTEIRELAARLQKAFENSAEYIFSNFPLKEKPSSGFAWSASCKTYRSQNNCHEAHNICFHMRKEEGAWSVDRNQLEAALGLWSWSLHQDAKSPKCDKHFKSIVVGHGEQSRCLDTLNKWVNQTSGKLRCFSGCNSPLTLLSIPNETLISMHLQKESKASKNKADDPVPRHNLASPASAAKATYTMYFRSTNSRLQLIAQDLFTIFMKRVATITNPLEEKSYHAPPSKDVPGGRKPPFLGMFTAHPLFNPEIEALTNILVDAGVASREEALMSVVPALAEQNKIPKH